MRGDPARVLTDIVRALPVSHVDALAAALEALTGELAERQGRRAFGTCGTCRHLNPIWTESHGRRRPGCSLLAVPLAREELHALCARFEAR
jgi:hypothetical protein